MIYIDESGTTGSQDRFMIICICILDKKIYKKFKKYVHKLIKKFNIARKGKGQKLLTEIKANQMSYKEKRGVVDTLLKSNINFSFYIGILDKEHPHYIRTFNTDNKKPSKELAVNYLIRKIYLEEIFNKFNVSQQQNIFMDERNIAIEGRKSLEDYINVGLLEPEKNGSINLNYVDSKFCFGVQLADIISNIFRTYFEHNKNKYLVGELNKYKEKEIFYPI